MAYRYIMGRRARGDTAEEYLPVEGIMVGGETCQTSGEEVGTKAVAEPRKGPDLKVGVKFGVNSQGGEGRRGPAAGMRSEGPASRKSAADPDSRTAHASRVKSRPRLLIATILLIVSENLPSFIAPSHHVIDGTWKLHSNRSGHALSLPQSGAVVNCKGRVAQRDVF